jgi:hypothetical protein
MAGNPHAGVAAGPVPGAPCVIGTADIIAGAVRVIGSILNGNNDLSGRSGVTGAVIGTGSGIIRTAARAQRECASD